VQSEIGALKDTHENVNRNAANDSQRFGSTQPNGRAQKNKKIGTTLKANINNAWQTTSAEKKIVKTVQSEKSNYEESDYNEKNKI
jgi:hypothetical protein